jgi:hypothetical protein
MSRHLATILASTAIAVAIAACSTEPQAMTASANTVSITQDSLVSAPLAPEPAPLAVAEAFAPPPPVELSPVQPPPLAVPPEPAPIPAPKPAPAVRTARADSCDIRVEHTSHGVLLTAVANTERSGDYSFVITKRGESGSSDINQGGPFEAGRRIELGASEVSLDRGSSYRATLVLTSSGRELCRRTIRS